MKVILSMAITPNGLIATPEGIASFVSREYVDGLHKLAKEVGNIVIGRGTYNVMIEAKAFPLPGVKNVVMTSSIPEAENLKNITFFEQSAEELLEYMKKQGFETILLAGGGELLGGFMTDGLIDEMYLTIEPVVFGDGIRLFGFGEFERKLELLDIEKTANGEVRLHYAVKKTLDAYFDGQD